MSLSIVTTLYRSERYLEEFYRRSSAAVLAVTDAYEIVFVNDGSPDASLDLALALAASDPRVKVVDLSRNFGHHRAMMTGLAHASGDYVFLVDSDLEEEPELLGEFLQHRENTGADVVFGVQAQRKGGGAERVTGALYYAVFNALSTYPIPRNLLTVRLMSRRYVDALVLHRERELNIGGLWAITGFLQVPYVVTKHHKGVSTYNVRRKVGHVVDSITSFSNKPLVFIFYLGTGISIIASAAATVLVVRRVFFGVLLEGWPSLIVSVWLLGGLTLFCLGIIGIYLAKVFTEAKQRPYTIVRGIYQAKAATDDKERLSEPSRARVSATAQAAERR